MKILVSGSLAFDSILDFNDHFKNHILPDTIHNINVSFLVENLRVNFGGNAGNIAYNLALMEELPIILSTAGNDFYKYKKKLIENKVDTSNIKVISNINTAFAHIVTDLGDNQITAFYPGAMKYSFGEIKKTFLNNKNIAIIAPGNKDDMVKLSKMYTKNKVPYIFDPGQQITAFSGDELKRMIINGASPLVMRDYAIDKLGLTTLRRGGILKVLKGDTSVEEIAKNT